MGLRQDSWDGVVAECKSVCLACPTPSSPIILILLTNTNINSNNTTNKSNSFMADKAYPFAIDCKVLLKYFSGVTLYKKSVWVPGPVDK